MRGGTEIRAAESELSDERWEHIVDGRPELGPHQGDVLRAVEAPTETPSG